MYKWRLHSFVAYLLELTTCVLELMPEKKREERKVEKKKEKKREEQPFNMGNINQRNVARKAPNATVAFKKYRRCRARDAPPLASADVGAHALDRL